MSKTAPEQRDELVVLFVRIRKSQRSTIEKISKERKLSVADTVRDLITLGVSQQNTGIRPVQNVEVLTSLEKILVEHSKQAMLNDAKVIEIVSNIYATQLGAKSETEKIDAPEGVFLLPAAPEDKKGKFYCQGCGIENSNRQKHTIKVGEEQVVVADCCYFNDRYKELVRAIL